MALFFTYFNFEVNAQRFSFIEKGLPSFDRLVGSNLTQRLDSLKTRITDWFPEPGFDRKIRLTRDSLFFVAAAPILIFGALIQIKNHIQSKKVRDFFEATSILSFLAYTMKLTLERVSPYIDNSTVHKISSVALPILDHIVNVGSLGRIVANVITIRELSNLQKTVASLQNSSSTIEDSPDDLCMKCFLMDKADVKSFAFTHKEAVLNQMQNYQIRNYVATAAIIAHFSATVIFAASPFSPLVLMAYALTEIALDTWWQLRANSFRKQLGLRSISMVSVISNVVNLTALPFLFAKPTRIIAGVTIVASVLFDRKFG